MADHVGAEEPDQTTGAVNAESLILVLPVEGLSLEGIERAALIWALERSDWKQNAASRLLRMSTRVMNDKVRKHGITHPRWYRHKPS